MFKSKYQIISKIQVLNRTYRNVFVFDIDIWDKVVIWITPKGGFTYWQILSFDINKQKR
jgi:hypothetical protein